MPLGAPWVSLGSEGHVCLLEESWVPLGECYMSLGGSLDLGAFKRALYFSSPRVLPGASNRLIHACRRVLSASRRVMGVSKRILSASRRVRMSTEGSWMHLVEYYSAYRMILGASMGVLGASRRTLGASNMVLVYLV